MSIKKLFDSTEKSRNYLTEKTDKTAFEDVESGRNIEEIVRKQEHFQPQIDYTNPAKFARFGSATLYYKSAFTRILDYYPYDGSDAEINKFYNDCLDIERNILDTQYPRTNGYAILGAATGTVGLDTPSSIIENWGLHSNTANREYIHFLGGPGTGSAESNALKSLSINKYNDSYKNSNVYDTDLYKTDGLPSDYGKGTRTSNLRSNFDDGVTIEFWLKLGYLESVTFGSKQAICDIWNGAPSASADYGRITLNLEADIGPPYANRSLKLTVFSGSTGVLEKELGVGSGRVISSDTITEWNHYAVTIENSGSSQIAKLYMNGAIASLTTLHGSTLGELNPKPTDKVDGSTWKGGLRANIGALLTAPSGTADDAAVEPDTFLGAGRLSGSLDEFRFWKSGRNAKQIGERYFTQVRGGTNTDISNTTLGVYYKFNEGITGTSSVDSSVLDYAGRVTNGVWTGYKPVSRNVGSAIVSASAAPKEYKDPIIRPMHPKVKDLRGALVASGTFHDQNNNSSLLSLLPGWILDSEEVGQDTDLQNICHIMGAYFDTLYLQISEIPKLRHLNYTSASHKAIPFAEHLPQSLGLYSPALFIDASVMEKFTNRTGEQLFEGDLAETKNLIYSNLYNNLTAIYKAKGTEKAIRNVFRCFNIDEKLLRLTIHSNREEYTLRSNAQQTLIAKNCANFNTASQAQAVIYQKSSSASGWSSRGYITGSSRLNPYGFTMEANIIFPYFDTTETDYDRRFLSSSLFGATTVLDGVPANKTGADTTFPNNRGLSNADVANFQVSFVRDEASSRSGHFKLESKYNGAGGIGPFPTLTSSIFWDVYDNQLWNIAVRIRPDTFPLGGLVEGDQGTVYPYVVEFYGVNTIEETIANSFKITGSMTNQEGKAFNQCGKRIYVGALRNNLTGTIINKSDVLVSSVKYWTKYLQDSTLVKHAVDVENFGISGSFLPLSPIDSNSTEIVNADTLALNWNFLNVTGSDSNGSFSVQDFSSGSSPNKGWIDAITKVQHPGHGYGFKASSSEAMDQRHVNSYRYTHPENVVSSDMIRIFDDEERMYPPTEFVPNYIYTIEKSLYNAVSEEILDFFAGVVDFNTLIGAPVNRYRGRYKALEHMSEIFFQRVSEVKQVERYLKYYQWFDDAISTLIAQLVPASSEYVDDILNVVESHVLERPKYQSRFPTLNFYDAEPQGFVNGYAAAHYPARLGRSPEPRSPRDTKIHEKFWKDRALRDSPEISSGDARVDIDREKLRKIVTSQPRLSGTNPTLSSSVGGRYLANQYQDRAFTKVYSLSAISHSSYHGGVNFSPLKNLGFARTSVLPAGPVNTEGGIFVPENVLLALPEDYVETTNFKEIDSPPEQIHKIHRIYKVQSGRDWQLGQGYYNMKSTVSFPFNIMSASISGGYSDHIQTEVTANIDITNLHNDVYGPMMEKPMQGPFTEEVVGGLQSRHQPINFSALDTWHTRPEQFRILLGSCTGMPGAIGVVGPDYPWPEANNPGDTPYPITGSRKAYLFRDMVAKRPVNTRNIEANTGSRPSNYNFTQQYEVLNSFGSYVNPRQFIDNQPPLPARAFDGSTRYATQMRTYLDIRRTAEGHQQLLPDYSVGYLTGAQNQQIFTTRFANPGCVQTMGVGYRDIRGNEYSVYNARAYRNIEYLRPSQMPSGTISEPTGAGTPGIRLFDIHGKDIGEIAHRARHSAKFGRDSVYSSETVPVTGQPAAYGLTASMEPRFIKGPLEYGGAGYGYTQADVNALQGWWRLNTDLSSSLAAPDSSGQGRNGTIAASEAPYEYSSWYPPNTTNVANTPTTSYIQKVSNYFASSDEDRINIGTSALWDGIIGNDTSNGATQKMTFAAWIMKWTNGEGTATHSRNSPRIFDFSDDIFAYARTDGRLIFVVKWDGKYIYWCTTNSVINNANGVLADALWQHVAITYDANSTSNQPKIYINGQRTPIYLALGEPSGPYYGIFSSYNCYIGGSDRTGVSGAECNWSGFIADFAIWNQELSEGAVRAIYHAGLYGITETNPNAPGASYDQLPARYKIHRNSKSRIRQLADGTYVTSSRYDNYNVQHPIPQSDLQYRWIANSVVDPNNTYYFGYQKTSGADRSFKSSSINGLSPYWTFVSASEVMPTIESSGGYGATQVGKSAFAGGYQPIGRLNTITLDAVSGASNTLGFPADANAPVAYLNDTLNNTAYIQSASYLNMLLSRRAATYGWTWQMWRRTSDTSPVLMEEMRANELSAVTGGAQYMHTFRLPPISMKGRTSRLNLDSAYANPVQLSAGKRNNMTLRASHTNEKIFFNEVELNNIASPALKTIYTPLIHAIDMTDDYRMAKNWVIYTQNIYPSMRNEFTTRSTSRPGFDNGFWRNLNPARVALGADTENSFGCTNVSQSAWCLDAPEDFLTRTQPNNIQYPFPGGVPGPPQAGRLANISPNAGPGWYATRNEGKAGELQNTYSSYLYSPARAFNASQDQRIFYANVLPSALYARKHMLGSPRSVVAPSGIEIPETGTNPSISRLATTYTTVFEGPFGMATLSSISASNPYSGEALWEASRTSGIIRRTPGSQSAQFLVSSSNPWFNDYDAFHTDLKLLARGYSTVPEFRISEHIEDYIKFGILDPNNMDTFGIPGTGINSSTASFYKDFSNSDFMQDFLKIKNKTLFDINELKLTCEAAIRFNPYKGFYPAQRTLDLVSQFSRSYGPGMFAPQPIISGAYFGDQTLQMVTGGTNQFNWQGGAFRPLIAPLFAPGILYNSIKSGMAVDYPVVTNPDRLVPKAYGGANSGPHGPLNGYSPDNYAFTVKDEQGSNKDPLGVFGGSYFDLRLPFEAIIEPDSFIRNQYFLDMEPHPSCSMAVTASWAGDTDGAYTRMAANFFGEVGSFFLKDKDFTNLESNVVPTDLKFQKGDVFGARLTLKRSMRGPRTYQHETGAYGDPFVFTELGGRTWVADDPNVNPYSGSADNARGWLTSSYPIPQDPKRNPSYRETFTMYSRPTAFGPPLSGRYWGSGGVPAGAIDSNPGQVAVSSSVGNSGSMDCFDGYNWAYTPPYYHGEAWVDFIFRPSASVSYDLEKILAETEVQYWRVDGGAQSGSAANGTDFTTVLIPGGPANRHGGASTGDNNPPEPYSGLVVNSNAMQLSASFNLFGIQRVFKTQGINGLQTNETIGAKWIIQPKFETPMLNFGDYGLHPNTSASSNLTIPLYGSASVPRGMWHQFGKLPETRDQGIFLSIAEIPAQWLNNHWMVINTGSIYNNYNIPSGSKRFNQGSNYKSLAKLFGFDRRNSKIRLGEMAEEQVMREAVVAVPYILNQSPVGDNPEPCSDQITTQKKFISIAPARLQAAMAPAGTRAASDLGLSGRSIRKLVQKMKRYVLPPQFDFINNQKIDPMVMYIFEFEYKLDRDDLSYIWQNLAPRDYQKLTFQKTSVAHEVFDTELLNEKNLIDHPDLRWMVFKVKQRSQIEYWDLIADQARQASTQIWGDLKKPPEGYDLAYNWPYDFISFVEAIKIDVDVMYKNPANNRVSKSRIDAQKASAKRKDKLVQQAVQSANARANAKKK